MRMACSARLAGDALVRLTAKCGWLGAASDAEIEKNDLGHRPSLYWRARAIDVCDPADAVLCPVRTPSLLSLPVMMVLQGSARGPLNVVLASKGELGGYSCRSSMSTNSSTAHDNPMRLARGALAVSTLVFTSVCCIYTAVIDLIDDHTQIPEPFKSIYTASQAHAASMTRL